MISIEHGISYELDEKKFDEFLNLKARKPY